MTRVEKPKKTWVTVSDTVRGCPLCVFGHERVRDFFLSRKNLVVPTVSTSCIRPSEEESSAAQSPSLHARASSDFHAAAPPTSAHDARAAADAHGLLRGAPAVPHADHADRDTGTAPNQLHRAAAREREVHPGAGLLREHVLLGARPPPPRASIASVRLARRGRRDRGAIARAAPRAAAIAPAASKSSNEPRRGPVVIASQLCPTRRASSTRKPFFFLAPAPTSLPP